MASFLHRPVLSICFMLAAFRAAFSLESTNSLQVSKDGLHLSNVGCKTASEWKSRSIYFLLTDRFAQTPGSNRDPCNDFKTNARYCGGTFKGLESKLDYIKGMGFDAIWISPVQANADLGGGQGYHGYWAKSWKDINSNFGTLEEFGQLVSAAQNMGIWVMLDLALNHMVGNLADRYPFDRREHYHLCPGSSTYQCNPDCTVKCYDFDSNCQEKQDCASSIENCQLGGGLDDIDQSNQWVKDKTLELIKRVEGYNINGLRLDAVKHMPISYLRDFVTSQTECFTIGEALVNDPLKGCFQGTFQSGGAVDGVLNFAMQQALIKSFRGYKDNPGLASMTVVRDSYEGLKFAGSPGQSGLNGLFLDNHDFVAGNSRWLGENSDRDLLKNALAYVFTGTGIPILYYGTEQAYSDNGDDQKCRTPLWFSNYNTAAAIYNYVNQLNTIRKACKIWDYDQISLYTTNEIYTYSRGQMYVFLTNKKNYQQVTVLAANLPVGTKMCNVFDPKGSQGDCTSVFSGADGKSYFATYIYAQPKIFAPVGLPDSTCGNPFADQKAAFA